MALFSINFIIFLAILLLAYYLVPGRFQWMVLLFFSVIFYYLSGGPMAGVFLTVTILTTWISALWLDKKNQEMKRHLSPDGQTLTKQEKKAVKAEFTVKKRRVLVFTLLLNFGILAVLKYGNFVTANLNSVLAHFTDTRIGTANFLLPLGISFYTFQTMGYLLDVYNGRAEANRSLFRFALFSSYFPQIIQGPIGKYESLAPQMFGKHFFDPMNFRKGMLRLFWGYFKKVIIADRAALIATEVIQNFQIKGYSGLTVFIGILFYGIQMYTDFSGGIDMIMGVSEMLDIHLTENFRQPYMARTVSEFWQRWHISLGDWMKDYLFYPIALSRSFSKMGRWMKQKIGTYYGKVIPSVLASFIVFVIVGVWHGAAWKYVFFGIYHATLTSADSLLERTGEGLRKMFHINGASFSWRLFQMARTLVLISFGRYFDCTTGIRMTMRMFRATFRELQGWVLFDGSIYSSVMMQKEFYLLILAIIVLAIVDVINERGIVIREKIAGEGIVFRWLVYFTAITVLLIFGAYGPGFHAAAFIYQQF